MSKKVAVLGAVAIALLFAFVWIVVPRSPFLTGFIEHQVPGLVPASRLAHNLDSQDDDLVRESLAFLHRRANPIAVPRAIELLKSSDDYVWLNAALYLGACEQADAIPYLIKALRHTAWRSDPKTVAYLRTLTNQDFGTDFDAWQRWWVAQHPGTDFNWTSSLGHNPRVIGLKGD